MASVHDVAAYILSKTGEISAMKLQKLVYYSQAWHLVWEERPLFSARIEAWVNGPVVPDLYSIHRGSFTIAEWPWGRAEQLSPDERSSVDAVLKHYGDKSSVWLSDLTHAEQPWKLARQGLAPDERGSTAITLDSMAEYYGSLPT